MKNSKKIITMLSMLAVMAAGTIEGAASKNPSNLLFEAVKTTVEIPVAKIEEKDLTKLTEKLATVIDLLIEEGADINFVDRDRKTPLIWAVEKNHAMIATMLLAKGANLDAKDKNNKSALDYAIEKNPDLAKELIEEKSVFPIPQQKLSRGSEDVNNLLFEAVEATVRTPVAKIKKEDLTTLTKKLATVIHLLVKEGADINFADKDKDQKTPLIWAAEKNHTMVATMLLAEGANVNAKDKNNRSALFYADANKNLELKKELIKKGADIDQIKKAVPILPDAPEERTKTAKRTAISDASERVSKALEKLLEAAQRVKKTN